MRTNHAFRNGGFENSEEGLEKIPKVGIFGVGGKETKGKPRDPNFGGQRGRIRKKRKETAKKQPKNHRHFLQYLA